MPGSEHQPGLTLESLPIVDRVRGVRAACAAIVAVALAVPAIVGVLCATERTISIEAEISVARSGARSVVLRVRSSDPRWSEIRPDCPVQLEFAGDSLLGPQSARGVVVRLDDSTDSAVRADDKVEVEVEVMLLERESGRGAAVELGTGMSGVARFEIRRESLARALWGAS